VPTDPNPDPRETTVAGENEVPAPAGGLDFGALLGQAQEMMAATAEAASEEVEGVAGGGAVRISVNGRFEFSSVTISPDAVDPADVAMLEDLVLAALNDASAQIAARQQQALGGLGGLSGLLGG
jgi:DNA-binding YbaB/EbfC family protein